MSLFRADPMWKRLHGAIVPAFQQGIIQIDVGSVIVRELQFL